MPFQFDNALVQRAIDRVAAAVAKVGKWWGIPTGTPEAGQKALDRGARMITGGNDHLSLLRGFQTAYKEFSQLKIN